MQKQRLHQDRFPRDVGLRAAHLAAGQWGLHCSSCRLRIKKLRTFKSWRIQRRWWKRYPSCICMSWVACYHSIKSINIISYHIISYHIHSMKMGNLRAAVVKIGMLATLRPSSAAVILSSLSLLGLWQEEQPNNLPSRKAKIGGHRISKIHRWWRYIHATICHKKDEIRGLPMKHIPRTSFVVASSCKSFRIHLNDPAPPRSQSWQTSFYWFLFSNCLSWETIARGKNVIAVWRLQSQMGGDTSRWTFSEEQKIIEA